MKTNRALLILVAIVGIGALCFWIWTQKFQGPKSDWQSVKVNRGPFSFRVQASGTIAPENRFLVLPPVNGRVDQFFVDEGALVKKGQKVASMSSQDRVALLESSKGSLSPELQEMYQPISLVAPESGLVISRPVNLGQNVSPQDRLFEIASRLVVESRVDESDIAQVQMGQKVDLVVDAFRDEKIAGRVVRIGHQSVVQNNINTYLVLIEISDPPASLRSGMSVSTYFVLSEKENALLLPAFIAQGKSKEKISINIKNNEGKIQGKTIEIGQSNGEFVEVVEGLTEGDLVYFQPLNIEVFKNSFMNSRTKK